MFKISRLASALAITALLTIAAAAGTAVAATHAHAAAAKYPPCTTSALKAGIRRGPGAVGHARFTKPFGCARRWAYSGGLVGHGRAEVEVTVLYHAVNGRWQTSNRSGPCRTHAVPQKIYKSACLTN